MNQVSRLSVSVAVAFVFYGGWSLFANSLATDEMDILIRSALVQGTYSALVTLTFTWMLEQAYCKSASKHISFAFVVPLVCWVHHDTKQAGLMRQVFNDTLDRSATWFNGQCWPGAAFAPLLPLAIQATLVIGVNTLNQTPNLALTVAPSILFSGMYGYMYTIVLYKKTHKKKPQHNHPLNERRSADIV